MIAQSFGFTKHLLKERNNKTTKVVPCRYKDAFLFKDQGRARQSNDKWARGIYIGCACLLTVGAVHAYDVNDTLSIDGLLAAGWQHQFIKNNVYGADEGMGAVPFRPALSFRPTQVDEIYVKLGFAVGDGLDEVSPFVLAPWAADLEDDVKNINGRGRDHLLMVWYKHTFDLWDNNSLGVTFGIIDSTDYLDNNAHANDEYTQFMNEALVNSADSFFPSYDIGSALEWDVGSWFIRGVAMEIGENDDGASYMFYGGQLGVTIESGLGVGNYRIIVDGTSKDFLDPAGAENERLSSILFSFDQQFGQAVGGFLRFGKEDDAASITYKAIYSGGLDIRGKSWRRAKDNIGIGYALLDGGNGNIRKTQVLEAYYRFVFNDHVALTADLQYMDDELQEGPGPEGYIVGLRATAEF